MSEERIFVLVADTVQHPLGIDLRGFGPAVLMSLPETKTIVQPKGRIAAQVGHVVSRMRMCRLERMSHESGITNIDLQMEPFRAITTIVLAVPDSYNLEFRTSLIRRARIRFHCFYDQNEEYGAGDVLTAVCTEPIESERLYGVTDYLSLWS